MATGKDGAVGRQLRAVFNLGAVRDLTDGQLLERFAAGRGEGAELAFAALVERHGPMVLRVARAILGDPHDADDAFQATFLVLVAKARGLWTRDSLGPWLHQVAHRTASCAQSKAARRRKLDRRAAPAAGASPPEVDADLARILHEEIDRLPERYRVPVVLCDLEGRTHEQAAHALGWPVGTVKSRQARARDRLRDRLARRGVAPGLGLAVIQPALNFSFPTILVESTTAAAVRLTLCRAIVPGSAAALAREVMRTMTILQWGKAAPFLLALGAAASGTGLIAQNGGNKPGDAPKPVAETQAAPPADPSTVEVKSGKLDQTLTEHGVVEPSNFHDVLCEVEGGTVINRILPDGRQLKQGEVIAELESATLRDQLMNQRVTVLQAEAAYKQALLTREIAEYAVKEYVEGVAPQELATLQGKIANSQADIDRSRARLERIKLARKRLDLAAAHRAGTETPSDILADLTVADRLESAELGLQSSTFDLEKARLEQTIYKTYTLDKATKQLKIDVEKARANEVNKQSSWELEKIKVAKLERQIEKCTLVASTDGVLVYASNSRPGQNEAAVVIEEGATVRERQKIFSVVDVAGPMRVNAKVGEAWVDQVKLGQAVRIKVEAYPNEILTGVIMSVAPRIDAKAYAANQAKIYPTMIQLDQGNPKIRPGMNARVEIPIFELDDVLSVPTSGLLLIDDKDRVLVKTPEGAVELREVTLGKSNRQAVEVKRGLRAGDRVFLNPATMLTEPMTEALRRRATRSLAFPPPGRPIGP